jgi:hypothetical protein
MADHFRLTVAAIMLGVLVGGLSQLPRAQAEPITVQAKPVLLHSFDPSVTRVGRLAYRGGLQLSSSDPRFGGLSGLLVSADGRRLTAISDRGHWFEADLVYDNSGTLIGMDQAAIERLRDLDGRPIAQQGEGDAEGLALGAAGKGIVVSFETRPRLWAYPTIGGLPVRLRAPKGLEKAPKNAGIEAITRLADGRLLALTEGLRTEGGSVGWIGGERARWSEVTWLTGGGFQPTGATTLSDRDVLVLERRIMPPGARIRLVQASDIKPGAVLDGQEIARFEGMLTFDNMEGIGARRSEGGESLVYLLSDDNYSFLQRTLLLMFRMVN